MAACRLGLLRCKTLSGDRYVDDQPDAMPSWRGPCFQPGSAHCIYVRDVELCWNDPDYLEVVAVLMVAKEFGFTRSSFDTTVHELREMQKSWTTLGTEFVREAAAA